MLLAEKFKLEFIRDVLLLELFRSLKDIPHIPDVVLNSEEFKTLPFNLVKDILLFDTTVLVFGPKSVGIPSTKERFDAFVFWLTENACSNNDKKRITESLMFDNFTLEELLTDVRSSGLYPSQRIDARVLEIHQSCQKSFELTEKTIKEKSRLLERKKRR